jgi:hypothetical protein
MKWITEYFIKKTIKSAPQAHQEKNPLVYGEIKSISLIATSLVEMHETEDLIKLELGPKIEMTSLFYGEGSEAKQAFSHQDFHWSGKPKTKIHRFLEKKTDVIIASSENLNVFSLYLLYLNPKPYSVGFYQERHKPYLDLMLSKEDRNQKESMVHLIKYLKQVILK